MPILRKFKTKNFEVIARTEKDDYPDFSWDEDGSARQGIKEGKYKLFCVSVKVFYKGKEVGSDYLGGCIYETYNSFMDHKECGKQNREYEANGESGRCGSYFSDMISQAISEARKTLGDKPYIRSVK